MPAETTVRRRGLRFFSRSQPVGAEYLGMEPPVWDSATVDAAPEFFAGGGSASAALFVDPEGDDEHRLSLLWLRLGSNYQLPRHSHTEDCLYYVVSGEVHLGRRTVGPGEGFFVPSEAPYSYTAGPEGAEVLEFRGTGRPIRSRTHESAAGWRRILDGVRANRGRWASEMQPYSRWCRQGQAVPYTTPEGESRTVAVQR